MHKTTYEYLKPTDQQMSSMAAVREAAKAYSDTLETHVPSGPDLTYILRKLREVGMWANLSITRNPDGSPRQ
jgi:hypothetical protein